MTLTVTPAASVAAVAAAASAPAGLDLTLLRQGNPKLDALLAARPEITKLLERNAARGAFAAPAAGDVQTRFTWPIWTHSPRSSPGSITAANEKDVIVVWQETPGLASKVSLGRYEFPGQIIGVHQVDARGPSSTASDNGFIWPSMTVVASGKKDAPLTMRWAVVTLDAQGMATSGGFPGGWAGRTFATEHGKAQFIPLKG